MTHEDNDTEHDETITNPDWAECDAMWKQVHEWRRYASEDVRKLWPTFTYEQQVAIKEMLDGIASDEEWE